MRESYKKGGLAIVAALVIVRADSRVADSSSATLTGCKSRVPQMFESMAGICSV